MRVLSRSLILSSALALGLSVVPQDDAAARSREARPRSGASHQQITRTGPDGRSRTWQKDTSWQRGGGSAERHTTWTGPQGRTASRDAVVTRDPESGTRTQDVVRTGPRGATTQRHSVIQKTEDGHINTTSVTRPDGSVVSWEKTLERE